MKRLPTDRWVKYALIGVGAAAAGFVALFLFASWRYSVGCWNTVRRNCQEHVVAGCVLDGTYTVDLGGKPTPVYCDQTTDGGGWMMVLNYVHSARSTIPSPTVLNDRLPLRTGAGLGGDESASTSAWGHASPDLLDKIDFTEVRLFCQTAAHPRQLHFKFGGEACLRYLKTGQGSCQDSTGKLTPLPGNSGNLTQGGAVADKNKGQGALTTQVFYVPWRHGWNTGSDPNRWDCDDVAMQKKSDTVHEAYVR
jgi:hypothetical protein